MIQCMVMEEVNGTKSSSNIESYDACVSTDVSYSLH